jgi:type I restriction enzyme S subunit
MTGAAIKRIILRTIKNLQIPIVDLKTQKELGELIENNLLSVNAYKSGLAKKISLVKSLRQSFLNVSFTQEEAVA